MSHVGRERRQRSLVKAPSSHELQHGFRGMRVVSYFVHAATSADVRCGSVLPAAYRIPASQLPMEQASFGRAKDVLQVRFKARKQITERSLGANGG
jgi:hypothetical protein